MNQEKKIKDLQEKIEQLTKMVEESQKPKSNESLYESISSDRMIVLMNMMDAGGTYSVDGVPPIRFDEFGSMQRVKFEDLNALISKYRETFKQIGIRIVNADDVVDVLYLRTYYDKYDITKEELENLISLGTDEMIKKIKSLSNYLKESAFSIMISGVAEGNAKYMDRNKWKAIKDNFGVDIEKYSSKYPKE
ncbi:MAG: hypothetical protein ACOCUD_04735 [Bacillota bacterium]